MGCWWASAERYTHQRMNSQKPNNQMIGISRNDSKPGQVSDTILDTLLASHAKCRPALGRQLQNKKCNSPGGELHNAGNGFLFLLLHRCLDLGPAGFRGSRNPGFGRRTHVTFLGAAHFGGAWRRGAEHVRQLFFQLLYPLFESRSAFELFNS